MSQEQSRAQSSNVQDQRDSALDRLGQDLTSVMGSLQSSVEQMRAAAQQEVERIRAGHEAERSRLQSEVEQLRARCDKQSDSLKSVRSLVLSLMQDYRDELERHLQQADNSRSQIERLGEAMSLLEVTNFSEPAQTAASPQPSSAVEGAASTSAQSESSEESTRIAIAGINSVSAMMRARKAVENMESIQGIESRYAADGTLYLSVRTDASVDDLAEQLTSLPDPQWELVKVEGRSIELQM